MAGMTGMTGGGASTRGGTPVAGALARARAGRLEPDDELVLCITGHGLKTLEALGDVAASAPVIEPRLRDVAALAARAETQSAS
jgi:threonine synthase